VAQVNELQKFRAPEDRSSVSRLEADRRLMHARGVTKSR
jgi:hypothetical protein